MGKQRGRLDPGEVKRALAAERHEVTPEEPFHTPFAAARAQLEKIVPAPGPPGGKATVADRLRRRAEERPRESSELARVRAEHRAARAALAEAVKPIRREAGRRAAPGAGSDGKADDDER